MSSPIILNYKIIFNIVDTINNIKDDYITNLEKVNNIILQIPLHDLTWNNFIQPLINFNNTYTNRAILNMKNFLESYF